MFPIFVPYLQKDMEKRPMNTEKNTYSSVKN